MASPLGMLFGKLAWQMEDIPLWGCNCRTRLLLLKELSESLVDTDIRACSLMRLTGIKLLTKPVSQIAMVIAWIYHQIGYNSTSTLRAWHKNKTKRTFGKVSYAEITIACRLDWYQKLSHLFCGQRGCIAWGIIPHALDCVASSGDC